MTLGLLVGVLAAPGAAKTNVLDGPDPAIWLSDPEGDDGDNGIEQGDPVAQSSGNAKIKKDGAEIRVRASGLVPGHTYTMWVVYFNDSTTCVGGCNGEDLSMSVAKGGVMFGDGQIAGGNGKVTFTARLNTGDNAAIHGPPPPFGFAAYVAGENNEFHVVIRSHGPQIEGQVDLQLSTFGGGCDKDKEVGPQPPGTPGDFPVPSAEGECGDIQLYVFK
jgi:hypothetical protein